MVEHSPQILASEVKAIIIIVVALQMTSQPISSIFLCSPLPSGSWRTPGLYRVQSEIQTVCCTAVGTVGAGFLGFHPVHPCTLTSNRSPQPSHTDKDLGKHINKRTCFERKTHYNFQEILNLVVIFFLLQPVFCLTCILL